MARSIAETLHFPRMRIVEVAHPLGGLSVDDVEDRVNTAIADIVAVLDLESGA